MRKLSLDNLLQKDVKLVEKKKIFFIVPAAIIVLAIVFGFIWWGARGTPINLSMDFTGGHVIQINAGNSINRDNVEGHIDNVYNFLSDAQFNSEGYIDANGNYSININRRDITTLGGDSELTIRVQFRSPATISAAEEAIWMENVTDELASHLNDMFGQAVPVVSAPNANRIVQAEFNIPILAHVQQGFFVQMLTDAGIDFVENSFVAVRTAPELNNNGEVINNGVFRILRFELSSGASPSVDELRTALTISDPFFGQAVPHAAVSGTVSSALIISAIAAILWALVFMLGYIIIRFEFASGIAIIISLIHDMVIMFAFITIFHIEVSATFIAIVITVLAYSINNSIIIFDRVRENRKVMYAKDKNVTANEVANKSVVETLGRNLSTTLTTIIMIAMIAIVTAIGGINDMVAFALPITIGFLAGLFSSTCLAPSIWSIIRKNNLAPRQGFNRRQSSDDKQPKEAVVISPQPAMAVSEE